MIKKNQMTKDQDIIQERIDFLVNEVKLNRSLRYYDQQKYSAKECDGLEEELRKLDPNNPLFYEFTKKSSKIRSILKPLIILIIAFVIIIVFVWYFYMFYYDPFIYG